MDLCSWKWYVCSYIRSCFQIFILNSLAFSRFWVQYHSAQERQNVNYGFQIVQHLESSLMKLLGPSENLASFHRDCHGIWLSNDNWSWWFFKVCPVNLTDNPNLLWLWFLWFLLMSTCVRCVSFWNRAVTLLTDFKNIFLDDLRQESILLFRSHFSLLQVNSFWGQRWYPSSLCLPAVVILC